MLRSLRRVVVGLAVPGLLMWGITPSQATEPWTGSVSLSVDDTTTTANDRSAALTVSLTQQRPSGYAVSVFDDTGARTWCSTSFTGLTATLSVSPPLHQSRTYRAHVTYGSCPATPPSGGSEPVTVRNVGYDGTVVMTAAAATTDANDRSTTLRVTVSKVRPSGYAVAVFDDTGARTWCSTSITATEWTIGVSPPLHSSRTYRAYMTPGGCPTTTPTGSEHDAASDPVTVTNVGYDGGVSLAAESATTTANNRSTSLTVTLAKPRPSGYAVVVFDDTGYRTWCSTTITSTSWQVSVSPPLHGSHTYRAYMVPGGCPATTPAGSDFDAASGPVTVRNVGYDGTVSLTAASATTNANDRSTTLRVTVSEVRPSGYAVAVFDDTGTRTWCSTYVTATEWDISVSPPLHGSRTYRAYMVPGGCPTTTPTGSEHDAASESITVTNVGYDGAVQVTADSVWVDAEDPSALLTVTISKPRPSGYAVSVFDDAGVRRWCSTSFSGTTFTLLVTPPADHAGTYTAYVDQGSCPATPPAAADRAAAITIYSGADNPAALDFVTVAPTLTAGGLAASQACLELSLSPTATHQLGSSLSDQQIACETSLATSGNLKTGLQAAINTAGAAGSVWWLLHNRTTSNPITNPTPPPPDPTDEEGENRTGPKNPKPPQLPSHWRADDLADALIEQNPNAELTPSDARDIAEQCLWQAARAGLNAFDDCKTLPIFATGNDVESATIHDAEALDVNPGWMLLKRGLRENVRWKDARCNALEDPVLPNPAFPSDAFQCDEYPFLSTDEGGPVSPAPHLKKIDATHNINQGSKLSGFYANCQLPKGSSKPFLVVPLATLDQSGDYQVLPVPTQTRLCNKAA